MADSPLDFALSVLQLQQRIKEQETQSAALKAQREFENNLAQNRANQDSEIAKLQIQDAQKKQEQSDANSIIKALSGQSSFIPSTAHLDESVLKRLQEGDEVEVSDEKGTKTKQKRGGGTLIPFQGGHLFVPTGPEAAAEMKKVLAERDDIILKNARTAIQLEQDVTRLNTLKLRLASEGNGSRIEIERAASARAVFERLSQKVEVQYSALDDDARASLRSKYDLLEPKEKDLLERSTTVLGAFLNQRAPAASPFANLETYGSADEIIDAARFSLPSVPAPVARPAASPSTSPSPREFNDKRARELAAKKRAGSLTPEEDAEAKALLGIR